MPPTPNRVQTLSAADPGHVELDGIVRKSTTDRSCARGMYGCRARGSTAVSSPGARWPPQPAVPIQGLQTEHPIRIVRGPERSACLLNV